MVHTRARDSIVERLDNNTLLTRAHKAIEKVYRYATVIERLLLSYCNAPHALSCLRRPSGGWLPGLSIANGLIYTCIAFFCCSGQPFLSSAAFGGYLHSLFNIDPFALYHPTNAQHHVFLNFCQQHRPANVKPYGGSLREHEDVDTCPLRGRRASGFLRGPQNTILSIRLPLHAYSNIQIL